MRRIIQKWGNSLALRIPRGIARDLGLDPGTEVDVMSDGEVLVIKPVRGRYSLEELVSRIDETNKQPECKVGQPHGREIW